MGRVVVHFSPWCASILNAVFKIQKYNFLSPFWKWQKSLHSAFMYRPAVACKAPSISIPAPHSPKPLPCDSFPPPSSDTIPLYPAILMYMTRSTFSCHGCLITWSNNHNLTCIPLHRVRRGNCYQERTTGAKGAAPLHTEPQCHTTLSPWHQSCGIKVHPCPSSLLCKRQYCGPGRELRLAFANERWCLIF